jgi:thiamine pyrophosphokinase
LKINRIILIANGNFTDLDFYRSQIKENDYIICADGGAKHALSLGLTPHLIIGDLDSLEESICRLLSEGPTQFIKYPSEKDESDLELALLKALDLEPQEIIIWGALGKRVDHFYANLMLLTLSLKSGITTKLIDEDHEIFVTDKTIELKGEKGDYVSLFPFSPQVKGITTTGLKYPLKNETLYLGPTRGLSNEFITTVAKVTIDEGLLLVIKVRKRPF